MAAFVLVGYLHKRAQVVFQALLVTSGDYMYDHTEGTEAGHSYRVSVCLQHLLVQTAFTFHRSGKTDRSELTAISWVSLVAAVSTPNSCISTVGRKLMIT